MIGLTLFPGLIVLAACTPRSDGSGRSDGRAPEAAIEVDHVVPSTPENLSWGRFPVDKPPVVTVRPGETVEIHTLAGLGVGSDEDPIADLGGIGIPASEVPQDLVDFWETRGSRPREGRDRRLITGPVYVEGAEPGDVLEVQILDIRTRVPWGMNFSAAHDRTPRAEPPRPEAQTSSASAARWRSRSSRSSSGSSG